MIEAPARHALLGGSGGAPARRRSARYGAEMLLVPGDRAGEEIGDMLGLAPAVALARITQHDRLDADVPPRAEIDTKSVATGTRGSGRVDHGGSGTLQKKT